MTDELTFNELRRANLNRLPQSKKDGSDWTAAQWLQAAVGELGEYANLRKKFERGDIKEFEVFRQAAADELADVVTYLDILAHQLNINLGSAVARKFNVVSERVGATTRLDFNDDINS